jgi:hypothetical protein
MKKLILAIQYYSRAYNHSLGYSVDDFIYQTKILDFYILDKY